jgi:hypothetical protein
MGSCDYNRGYIRERVFPFLVAIYRHGLQLFHVIHWRKARNAEVVVVFGCKKSHSAIDDFKKSHNRHNADHDPHAVEG